MGIIYEPKGKALEYSSLSCNLFNGCSHGCIYCYAPTILHRTRKQFIQSMPKKDVLKRIKKEAPKYRLDPRNILLCFTCDPYQPIELDMEMTRRTLLIFDEFQCTTTILTKGGKLATRDFDILKKNALNEFAITLTTDNDEESIEWEPGAALPNERIHALKQAHEMGIKTWISFEPVINPKAVYRLIEETANITDMYKIGKLNYHPLEKEINWRQFRETVEDLLQKMGKPYYIKKDLAVY